MIFGGWIIVAINALFEGAPFPALVACAAMLTLLGLFAFFRRYNLIQSSFTAGVELAATVTSIVPFFSDRLVYYEYDFMGQRYACRNRVKMTAPVKRLRERQPTIVLARAAKPHVAFIKDIYLERLK